MCLFFRTPALELAKVGRWENVPVKVMSWMQYFLNDWIELLAKFYLPLHSPTHIALHRKKSRTQMLGSYKDMFTLGRHPFYSLTFYFLTYTISVCYQAQMEWKLVCVSIMDVTTVKCVTGMTWCISQLRSFTTGTLKNAKFVELLFLNPFLYLIDCTLA